MADNSTLPVAVGTEVFANYDLAGVKYPRVKVTWGPASGTPNDTDIASGKPLPIQLRNSTGQSLSDTTGVLISTTQLAALTTTAQAMSVGYQLVALPTDQITLSVAADTAKLANGASGTYLTPKFQKITASLSGATTVVAAVTSKKIRVLAWDVVVNAAVNFKWQSHVTPTDITGLYYMAGQGNGVARGYNPLGYFETIAGEALDINLSGAVAVGGVLTYVEV